MTMKNTMADLVQAEPATSGPQPLDLHALYLQQSACKYVHGVYLTQPEAKAIATRLSGIAAITSVFIAASDSETLVLGEWLHGGLLDAVQALTWDISDCIEQAGDRKKGGAA